MGFVFFLVFVLLVIGLTIPGLVLGIVFKLKKKKSWLVTALFSLSLLALTFPLSIFFFFSFILLSATGINPEMLLLLSPILFGVGLVGLIAAKLYQRRTGRAVKKGLLPFLKVLMYIGFTIIVYPAILEIASRAME